VKKSDAIDNTILQTDATSLSQFSFAKETVVGSAATTFLTTTGPCHNGGVASLD